MRQQQQLLLPHLLSLLLLFVTLSRGHNITSILAQHPEFSTFNHYLTVTHLAAEINRRLTITVLAVDNPAMAALLTAHPSLSIYSLKHLLSLHVLVDYFGAKKLHQLTGGSALTSTLFQAAGAAPGTAGFVNISDHRAGHVLFSASALAASAFVKSVEEIPYNLSIIQINSALSSPAAEAPVTAPAQINLTAVMAKKGCATFAGLLVATADAEQTFASNIDGGLTAFCPLDEAMKPFLPKFKNLTADGKLSLLLYHAIPVYYSVEMLKTGNGVVNTLATDGTARNYNLTVQNDGNQVTLRTRVTVATIMGTLIDEDPLAVYTIDKVLEPMELFKPAEPPAPAPAPETDKRAATAPKAGQSTSAKASPPAPAGPEGQPGDQKAADESAAMRSGVYWSMAAAAAAAAAIVVVV
ncbi:fasciclin-like arabinogalactan protein [Musa troglodytarum]|uniref:Fasciclin-like arabinogalactan protein n=1 Tax=Musa troglodytarum TaxID=320322 RepID=A0A9E7JL69_9LILI|nr:fasciclin-like arabinogalactan protein [Musa troglodytarum]